MHCGVNCVTYCVTFCVMRISPQQLAHCGARVRARSRNRITLWKYNGLKLKDISMEQLTRVIFRPAVAGQYPVRPPSAQGRREVKESAAAAAAAAVQQTAPTKYRPPGSSTADDAFDPFKDKAAEAKRIPVGATAPPPPADAPLSKEALKNMRKRQNRKKRSEEAAAGAAADQDEADS